MTGPAIVILSSGSLSLAKKVQSVCGGTVHAYRERVDEADVLFANTGDHLRELFASGTTIIGIMASGALVRILAPMLNDKRSEPAVLSLSDDGKSVIPLLGGHHGANQIARHLAEHLDGHAAVTTAGDVRLGLAIDEPPAG